MHPTDHRCVWDSREQCSSVIQAPDIAALFCGFSQVGRLVVCVGGCGPAPEPNPAVLSIDMASGYTLPYMTNNSGLYHSWADFSVQLWQARWSQRQRGFEPGGATRRRGHFGGKGNHLCWEWLVFLLDAAAQQEL